MSFMGVYCFVSLLFCLLLVFINFWLGGLYMFSADKDSSFECGFEFYGLSRLSFSMRYFLLTVIFVVFDVEVVLLFPGLFLMGSSYYFGVVICLGFFLLILFFGVMYEMREGSLSWSY